MKQNMWSCKDCGKGEYVATPVKVEPITYNACHAAANSRSICRGRVRRKGGAKNLRVIRPCILIVVSLPRSLFTLYLSSSTAAATRTLAHKAGEKLVSVWTVRRFPTNEYASKRSCRRGAPFTYLYTYLFSPAVLVAVGVAVSHTPAPVTWEQQFSTRKNCIPAIFNCRKPTNIGILH